jgi:long-subunit fatty acid transport protein
LQNAKTITPSIGSIEATEFNIDSTLKEQEWGVSLGLGIAFPITKRLNLGLELRNDAGLQNISDLTINNNGKIKTNETSALFSISYILIKSKDKDKDKEKDD